MTDVTPNFKAAPRVAKTRKPVKRQRAGSAAALKRKATKLWGEYIHARDRVCQVCGRGDGKLDAHHIMVRQHNATRTDETNGILVCFRCHQDLHSDPFTAITQYHRLLGEAGYAALRNKAYGSIGARYPASYWELEVSRLERLLAGVSS